MRHLVLVPIALVFTASAVMAKGNTGLQIIQVPVREVPVPVILIPRLKNQAKADEITFADPKNPFSAHEIDLNGDRKPELEVTCNGDATNWPIWFFSKDQSKYVQILKGYVGIYGYNVLKPVSHGYHDIMTIEHTSAVEHQITIYRFDGQKYKQIKSYSEVSRE